MAEWREALEDLTLEDCFFRMMYDHEIGRGGCGFDVDFAGYQGTFQVWGSASDRVDGYGNAVSPQVGWWISNRLRAVLHGPEATVSGRLFCRRRPGPCALRIAPSPLPASRLRPKRCCCEPNSHDGKYDAPAPGPPRPAPELLLPPDHYGGPALMTAPSTPCSHYTALLSSAINLNRPSWSS